MNHILQVINLLGSDERDEDASDSQKSLSDFEYSVSSCLMKCLLFQTKNLHCYTPILRHCGDQKNVDSSSSLQSTLLYPKKSSHNCYLLICMHTILRFLIPLIAWREKIQGVTQPRRRRTRTNSMWQKWNQFQEWAGLRLGLQPSLVLGYDKAGAL